MMKKKGIAALSFLPVASRTVQEGKEPKWQGERQGKTHLFLKKTDVPLIRGEL